MDAPTTAADRTAGALTLIVAALAALGVVLVYSSSAVGIGMNMQDPTFFLRRQVLWVFLGAGTFVLARTTPMHVWRRAAWPLLAGVVTLLLLVLVAGVERKTGGARRWLAVGGFQGQPSELAKLGMVLFMSAFAAGRREQLQTLAGAATGLGCVGLVAGLIAVEPDMGTALLTTFVATTILVVGGLRIRHLLLLGTPIGLGLVLFAFTRLGYIRQRVANFLDPNPRLGRPVGRGARRQPAEAPLSPRRAHRLHLRPGR
jgi:cell division protein FtsW